MATRHASTLRAQLLGQRLRELRDSAGLTLKDVAAYTQRDPSSISRMEAGIHPARVPDVLAYLSLCGITDAKRRNALVELAKDSWQTGWWDRFAGEYGPLADRIWLESRAIAIDSFEAIVIPGHLQIREYAAAVINADDPEATPEELTRDIELRMERKERIHSRPSLELNIIIDESVLHRQTGGHATMRDQLLHLVELADHSQIRIHVIPWAAGAHASLDGCFDVIKLKSPYPPVGYVYSPAGTVFLEGEDVDRLEARFRRLTALALDETQSKLLISRLANQ